MIWSRARRNKTQNTTSTSIGTIMVKNNTMAVLSGDGRALISTPFSIISCSRFEPRTICGNWT